MVLARREVSKDAELLVLRRQIGRVRYQPGDRLWFAALSVFHPAISRACRTWTALAICPARQGQQRSLRRIAQVLSWALARSPGARSFAWAELAAFWEAGLFRPRYGVRTCSPAPM